MPGQPGRGVARAGAADAELVRRGDWQPHPHPPAAEGTAGHVDVREHAAEGGGDLAGGKRLGIPARTPRILHRGHDPVRGQRAAVVRATAIAPGPVTSLGAAVVSSRSWLGNAPSNTGASARSPAHPPRRAARRQQAERRPQAVTRRLPARYRQWPFRSRPTPDSGTPARYRLRRSAPRGGHHASR